MSVLEAPDFRQELIRESARRELERRLCASHPAHLMDRVSCVDSATGESFVFQLIDPDAPWYWQRLLLDEWLATSKHISLKARQIGITWLAGAFGLWTILYQPGSHVLIVSIKEEDAVKVVNRVWDMLISLPTYLWNGGEVIKPVKARPNSEIQLQFPDGKVSSLRGLTSTPSAGHGASAALVILDEFSRQEYAQETWKAVLPTTQGKGRVLVISTANGVSNPQGGGNFFHYMWQNAGALGIEKKFLPWDQHPDRDEAWYGEHAMALKPEDRGEQYPRNPDEAFILTGSPYFDTESIAWYRAEAKSQVLEKFDFDVKPDGRTASRRVSRHGLISVYQMPEREAAYAIGADVATGRGEDFSAAYVVNLHNMDLVAQFHGKLDADLFAAQLHFLGKWYNTALIAVESAGGFGEAVLVPLRDGRAGRPAYPKLHRHVLSSRADMPVVKPFGFPITSKTRPLVISQLEKAIRDRSLPTMPEDLLEECRTFVRAETAPSPRPQSGCNDDCIMAAAITLEMYRLRGRHHARDAAWLERRSRKARPRAMYPWQNVDPRHDAVNEKLRYPSGG